MPRRTTTLGRTFLAGLVAILPIAVTLALLWWLGSSTEKLLGGLLQAVLPDVLYFPGLGLIAGVALVFALGLLLRAYLVQVIFAWADALLQRIPIVKTVYGAVQDLTRMFSGNMKHQFGQTVLVRFPGSDMRLMGFVTRTDLETIDAAFASRATAKDGATSSASQPACTEASPASDDQPIPTVAFESAANPKAPVQPNADASGAHDPLVAVYLPMSYMVGGYTVILPASQIEPTRMAFEDAMRFALTAGISAHLGESGRDDSQTASTGR